MCTRLTRVTVCVTHAYERLGAEQEQASVPLGSVGLGAEAHGQLARVLVLGPVPGLHAALRLRLEGRLQTQPAARVGGHALRQVDRDRADQRRLAAAAKECGLNYGILSAGVSNGG